MLNVIDSESPRISVDAPGLDEVDGLMVRKLSCDVCIWNVPGVSAVGMGRKDSRDETASVLADSIPYISQLRYLKGQ